MKRLVIALVVIGVAAAAGVAVWRQTVDNPVRRAASLVGDDADQERLWKETSSAHTRAALDRLAAPQPAGALATPPRQPPAQPVPQPDPDSIPPNVATTIRIVSRMSPDPTEYTGRATVVGVDLNGERIVLQLGPNREITVVARVAGKPLGVSKGDTVDVQLKWRPGRLEREQIIGVRRSGIDVATMVLTGSAPVTLKTVLLTGEPLILTQVGDPVSGSMALALRLPKLEDTIDIPKGGMGVGIERQYGARRIKVLGSVARAGRGRDGAPYGIDIITWQLP
jgi:hypothetical protein